MATRASIASSSLGDQLNCAVCLERFADPRTLPCHHSFCLRCLGSVPHRQEEDYVLMNCPTCRKSSRLPEGGTDQLPAAFLINNLLELQNQAEHDQEEESPSCDAHARPLEFYCSTCEALLCSVCTVKKHRTHNCDLASDVIEKCKQQIKQQLDLLEESARKVEAFIEKVDSATGKVQDEGDKTRQKIIAKVNQLHHDLELGKTELIDVLDQGVQDKMDILAHLREKVVTSLAQMRSSQSLVEETMQRKCTIELLVAKNELMRNILNARKQYQDQADELKFTTPSTIFFSSHPSEMEIGCLIEPDGLHHELKITTLVAGEKCSFLVYLVVTNEDDLVCQLVPTHDESQAIECQISPLKKGKYQISFTPHRVGTHNLMIVSTPTKKMIAKIQVNSPFLRGCRRQMCKQVLRKPRSVAITKEGQLVVFEKGADCITVYTTEGEKINIIRPSGSKKKPVFKPCCVGVTHDNHIVVIQPHQRIQLYKLQLDGKIVSTSTITSKDVSNFQSPNSITEHPNGQVFVVDSTSHCIHVFNADLSEFRSFGGKGAAPGQFNQPHSLAFDSSGNGYVSDSMNHRIQKFTMDGDLLNIFGKGDGSEASHLTQPTALCISLYDAIFVADERRRIAVFDVQGNLLGEVRYDKISLRNPCAMAAHKNESYICVIDSCVDALYVIQ